MAEVIIKLGIDWKILLLQIVNFIILFFILKKFLYKPVLNVIEARRTRIVESVKKMEQIEQEMENIKNIREEIILSAKKEASQTILAAKKQSEDLQKEMAQLTQEKIGVMLDESKKILALEKEKILSSVKKETADLIVSVTEKIVKENMSEESARILAEEALKSIRK